MNYLSFLKQRKGSGFLDIFFAPEVGRSKIRQIERECSRREMHAVNLSKCWFVLEAQMFAVSVTQKGLDYFVITLRIDQLQAYKSS